MIRSVRLLPALSLLVLALVAVPPLPAQEKAPLDYKSYGLWKSIQGSQISADGRWVLYTLTPREGDPEVVAREIATEREIRIPKGRGPGFSSDSRFLVCTVAPSAAELEQARKENRKPEDMPRTQLRIVELASDRMESVERVRGFRLPELGGSAVAYQVEPPAAPTPAQPANAPAASPMAGNRGQRGPSGTAAPRVLPAELWVRSLAGGPAESLGSALDYAWTRDGSRLAFTTGGERAAVKVRETSDGRILTLAGGAGRVVSPGWSRDGRRLAFLANLGPNQADPGYSVYLWQTGQENARRVAGHDSAALPPGVKITESSAPRFTRDGQRLYLNLAAPPRPARPAGSPEPLKVDLWHYRDGMIQPMQKVRSPLEGRRTYTAVLLPESERLVALGSAEVPSIDSPEQGDYALGTADEPYRMLASWDASYQDVHLVRLRDGQRLRVLEKYRGPLSFSPTGRLVLYFDAGRRVWRVLDVASRESRDLVRGATLRVTSETWDQPSPPATYGVAGWTADDRSVLLYDRYDVWEAPLNGRPARSLTAGEGRKRKITFRYTRADPDEVTIPENRPLLLSAVHEETGDQGYYRLPWPAAGARPQAPQPLLVLPKRFGPVVRARGANRFLFTLQRFDEFPDLWTTDADFQGLKRLSNANPQQGRFRWGQAELIRYRSRKGQELRGVLIRPEGADRRSRLPLLVNMYERLSSGLHNYVTPGAGTSPNLARFVSHGYAVLLPDIAYRVGHPGESAYDCVIPAVDRAIALGGIDPERVGITGHSWGGYQVSYLVARTDRFRAAVAGAPVVNMTSAYGGVRWQSGMSRAFQYERTQSRIGAPPWAALDLFIENSPLFKIDRVKTPLLILHNDADGAVPWYQGIELFSALRRLGREAYLFNYNDQGHGLTDAAAMRHWTVHMSEFLDRHLLGKPAPEWMEKGVPYPDRGTRDITSLFGSPPRPSGEAAMPPAEGG